MSLLIWICFEWLKMNWIEQFYLHRTFCHSHITAISKSEYHKLNQEEASLCIIVFWEEYIHYVNNKFCLKSWQKLFISSRLLKSFFVYLYIQFFCCCWYFLSSSCYSLSFVHRSRQQRFIGFILNEKILSVHLSVHFITIH